MTKFFVTKSQYFVTKRISDEIFLSRAPSANERHEMYFVKRSDSSRKVFSDGNFSSLNLLIDRYLLRSVGENEVMDRLERRLFSKHLR